LGIALAFTVLHRLRTGSWQRLRDPLTAVRHTAGVQTAAVVFSAVFGLLLLAVSGLCASVADRNHLSAWWLGSYGALIAGFMVLAVPMVGGGA
jgi:hypothetical protein